MRSDARERACAPEGRRDLPRRALLLGPLGLVVAALLVGPGGAVAQVAVVEGDYEAAWARYEASLTQRAEAQDAYNRSLNQVRAARAAAEEGRLAEAMAGFYTQARSLEEYDRRLQEAEAALEDAGRELIRVLDQREEELLEALEATGASFARDRILEELADIRRRVRSIEAEVESLQEVPVLPVPDVQPDPRDGPAETRAKYNLLASRVEEFDAVLEEIDERLEALERRLQRDRALQDQEAGIVRFDDLMIAPRIPTGGEPTTGGLPSGTAGASLGDLPLEEQIAMLRILRDQAAEVRDETRAQADAFFRLIPGGGG